MDEKGGFAVEQPILQVKGLKTYFYTDEGVLPGVDGLDFDLDRGQMLAIVGESGCGKSVTSLSILRIIQSPPGRIVAGEILYDGTDLLKLSEKQMRRIRGNQISMIFQEPMTSLNPVFTVGQQLEEGLRLHQQLDRKAARQRAVQMLELVGIPSPQRVIDEYPHQLSGGMRQRVMIAMALSCNPKILIADEPTTALDVTIQAQILRLISQLREQMGTSVILITHDLGVVAEVADAVMVMYAGQAVEYAGVGELFARPLHPYTEGLLKSVPVLGRKVDTLYSIPGTVPSPKDYPEGCRFAPRCAYCTPRCEKEAPPLYDLGGGRRVRCFRCEGGGIDG
ncbi:MAG TPA: ABC transporter ATP-binding protein [Candidatus Anaerotruncus excrementipullorum]|uniref:ABC transporter ATP-binding protein n=1 Tax=Candidatus Anaerotruncus excrementipullorum TaxID=2838465 RepID=A0A9D1WS69_9FIRM|nr:ABC transporter ATP-binding protein [Candidatus Anaerotruncus excrementipullorum]